MIRGRTVLKTLALRLYLAGYAAAREGHWIVHRAGYYTDGATIRVGGHRMFPGDFGVPALGPGMALVQRGVFAIYLPLRFAEGIFWSATLPAGAPWPYGPPEASAP